MPDHQLPSSAPSRIFDESSTPLRATLTLGAGRSPSGTRPPTPRAVAATQRGASGAAPVDTVPLKRLTSGRKELKIAHAGETYLLRVTKANKLILTKPATDEKPAADSNV